MEFVNSILNTPKLKEEDQQQQEMQEENGDDKKFKSKNLNAERRRREKLDKKLMALRSLVPNITNMTKVAIIGDAITYIQELESNAKNLSDELVELDAEVSQQMPIKPEIDVQEEMSNYGIQEDVQVTNMSGSKFWVKLILAKRKGVFSKFIEAMNLLGLQLIDVSVTTFKGAILVSSCVEGSCKDLLTVHQTREFVLELMRST